MVNPSLSSRQMGIFSLGSYSVLLIWVKYSLVKLFISLEHFSEFVMMQLQILMCFTGMLCKISIIYLFSYLFALETFIDNHQIGNGGRHAPKVRESGIEPRMAALRIIASLLVSFTLPVHQANLHWNWNSPWFKSKVSCAHILSSPRSTFCFSSNNCSNFLGSHIYIRGQRFF